MIYLSFDQAYKATSTHSLFHELDFYYFHFALILVRALCVVRFSLFLWSGLFCIRALSVCARSVIKTREHGGGAVESKGARKVWQ